MNLNLVVGKRLLASAVVVFTVIFSSVCNAGLGEFLKRCAWWIEGARPSPTYLFPDNGTKHIKFIRIHYPTHPENRAYFLALLNDVLPALKLDSQLELRIVATPPASSIESVLANTVPRRLAHRVRPFVIPSSSLRAWPRDPSLVIADGSALLLPSARMGGHEAEELEMEIPEEELKDYFETVEQYGALAGMEVRRASFRFEAGNILIGARHAFVGADIVAELMFWDGLTLDEAKARIGAELQLPVFMVGTVNERGGLGWQPKIHIDLAMAIVYDKVLKKEIAIVEDLNLANGIEGKNLNDHNDPTVLRMQDDLNSLAHDLEKEGYLVRRVPGVVGKFGRSEINYTNSIFSPRFALVPHFRVEKLDKAARREFQRMGYRVLPVRSAPELFGFGGGIRCATETGICL